MQPVVKEDFFKTILPEGVADTSYNKLSNLFLKTNEALFASDVDYNLQIGILIGVVTTISSSTAWYINNLWPIVFLFVVLIAVFISSMHLRTRRDQLMVEKSALKKVEDKNYVVIKDNFDTLLSKYIWIAFIFLVTILTCSICGLALSNAVTPIMITSGMVLGIVITYFFYYNNIVKIKFLKKKFQESYDQIIIG